MANWRRKPSCSRKLPVLRGPILLLRDAGTRIVNYYRFCRAGDRPGTLVFVLFELDDDGSAVRQIDISRGMFFTPARYTRDRPFWGNSKTGSHMRAGAFELAEIEDNRITSQEFELAWATNQYRVRDYHELKWMTLLLAKEGGSALQELLAEADAWYPNRSLSERLALCERAVRELLFEGLVLISGSDDSVSTADATEDLIPPIRYDEVLADWKAWLRVYWYNTGKSEAVLSDPMVYLVITEKGREAFDRATSLEPPWKID